MGSESRLSQAWLLMPKSDHGKGAAAGRVSQASRVWVPPPVCEGGDDQPRGVTQVLVGVLDLGVADVGEAVFLLVPAMAQL